MCSSLLKILVVERELSLRVGSREADISMLHRADDRGSTFARCMTRKALRGQCATTSHSTRVLSLNCQTATCLASIVVGFMFEAEF